MQVEHCSLIAYTGLIENHINDFGENTFCYMRTTLLYGAL